MLSGKMALRVVLSGATALMLTMATVPLGAPAYADTGVSAVVNKSVITTDDVAHRIAFLKLQHQKGDLKKVAQQQLVDEILKRQEILRVQMSVSTQDVDASYARFAANNKLSIDQLNKLLGQAGVTSDHFKAYIAVQMSWPRVVNARFGGGKLTTQDVTKRMLENKEKPITTEYFLQQIIFVIPASKKQTITKQRTAEAEASRSKFPGCDQSKIFAATMHDVAIRNLGRVLAPELPEDWKPLIEKASGGTTSTRVTERGVEYLAICKQRQVSDDVAAEVVFRSEDLGKKKDGVDPNEEKYLTELRDRANIVYK